MDSKLAAAEPTYPAGALREPADTAKYLTDQRNLLTGRAEIVLRPRTTDEVVEAVRFARAHELAIVPQGGNTSYVGGAVPDGSAGRMVLSLERLNRIRAVDPVNHTIAVEAGVILADARAAAAAAGMLLPLSLGSEGSCQIGGNIGTNAGGLSAVRYGVTRDLVLGLEVVLPDGRIIHGMSGLRKDNRGYALNHLFTGSEGTLGIVTGAVLKLVPEPRKVVTGWLALSDEAALPALLARFRRETSDLITSFEIISERSLGLVAEMRGRGIALPVGPAGSILIEVTASSDRLAIDEAAMGAMEAALEDGMITDAVLASSESQRADLWAIRETIPEGEKHAGGSVKHDISLTFDKLAPFLAEARTIIGAADPALELSYYGHVGDGNIHFNILVPKGRDRVEFTAETEAGLSHSLYDLTARLGGSFSAEHGIGRFKKDILAHYGDAPRLDVMRAIKAAIDPDDIMNPGVLF